MASSNPFKEALRAGRVQLGLWLALNDPLAAEICAGAGFDWLLLDAEHAPNDLRTLLAQMQAIGTKAEAVIRPPTGETWIIKQLLDLGARTLLIPMVESAAQAADIVAATRYPPRGVRSVASAVSRASGFGRNANYLSEAEDAICVLALVESKAGIANCEAIAATDGIDGIFFGAADLAADMGLLGQPSHARVQAAIEDGLKTVHRAGKAGGAFAANEEVARHLMALGARFFSFNADVTLLSRGTSSLVRRMSVLKTDGSAA